MSLAGSVGHIASSWAHLGDRLGEAEAVRTHQGDPSVKVEWVSTAAAIEDRRGERE